MLYYGGGGQFGFQTVEVQFQKPKRLKSELSEFRTPFRSDFGIVWISAVWISDIHCIWFSYLNHIFRLLLNYQIVRNTRSKKFPCVLFQENLVTFFNCIMHHLQEVEAKQKSQRSKVGKITSNLLLLLLLLLLNVHKISLLQKSHSDMGLDWQC